MSYLLCWEMSFLLHLRESLKKSQNYIRFDINKHKYPIRPSEEKGELWHDYMK